LAQFQLDTLDRDGVMNIIRSLNAAMDDDGLDQERLTQAFDKYWGDFQAAINQIPDAKNNEDKDEPAERSQREILEEILEHVRGRTGRRARKPLEIIGGRSLPPAQASSPVGMSAALSDIRPIIDVEGGGGGALAHEALLEWVQTYKDAVTTEILNAILELLMLFKTADSTPTEQRAEPLQVAHRKFDELLRHARVRELLVREYQGKQPDLGRDHPAP